MRIVRPALYTLLAATGCFLAGVLLREVVYEPRADGVPGARWREALPQGDVDVPREALLDLSPGVSELEARRSRRSQAARRITDRRADAQREVGEAPPAPAVSLGSAFSEQTRDPEWADRREVQLSGQLSELGAAHTLVECECRRELCFARIKHDDPGGHLDVMRTLRLADPFFIARDEDGTTLLYVAREARNLGPQHPISVE